MAAPPAPVVGRSGILRLRPVMMAASARIICVCCR
jgi:hypothetical protein